MTDAANLYDSLLEGSKMEPAEFSRTKRNIERFAKELKPHGCVYDQTKLKDYLGLLDEFYTGMYPF
jgi:hypothetical protein